MPRSDDSTKRQVDLHSMVRQFLSAMVREAVINTNATNGVAVFILTTIASSGIAIKALPKPSTECVSVETNRMPSTQK